jgi:hypothetical protein
MDTFFALLFREYLLSKQAFGQPSATPVHGLDLCICSDGWKVSNYMPANYMPGPEFLGAVFRGLRLMQEFLADNQQNNLLPLENVLAGKVDVKPVSRGDAIKHSTLREGSELEALERLQCFLALAISQKSSAPVAGQDVGCHWAAPSINLGLYLKSQMSRFRAGAKLVRMPKA